MNKLSEKAKLLPNSPGCYLMKNQQGIVIYVGKAKSLRARVGSYFGRAKKGIKTEVLISHIDSFDFIMTETEAEALVLENNLIKKYSPKYNICLKDDKSYPYVVVENDGPFSRLIYTRNPSKYRPRKIFGPFASGSNISQVLKIIVKSFLLRSCSRREFQGRKMPCLLYQLKHCSAPCVNYISASDYEVNLKQAMSFFGGDATRVIGLLKTKMKQASEEPAQFELALMLRNDIAVLEDFVAFANIQNVQMLEEQRDIDIVSHAFEKDELDIVIYMIRGGLLLGHKFFHLELRTSQERDLSSYLYQYYQQSANYLPQLIVTAFSKQQNSLLQQALRSRFPNIVVSSSGKKLASLSKLAYECAIENRRIRRQGNTSPFLGLEQLQKLLGLRESPILLEAFDVAVWQGKSPTASQIVFKNGAPDKSCYRHYHLKELPEGNNDLAMLEELLTRRLAHGNLPDVFVVDGGHGQVNTFLKVLKQHDVELPVVGIAKARSDTQEERLIIPGRSNPFLLKKAPALFKILVHMRDEAHRFARRLHHHAESKRLFGKGSV